VRIEYNLHPNAPSEKCLLLAGCKLASDKSSEAANILEMYLLQNEAENTFQKAINNKLNISKSELPEQSSLFDAQVS